MKYLSAIIALSLSYLIGVLNVMVTTTMVHINEDQHLLAKTVEKYDTQEKSTQFPDNWKIFETNNK